MSGRKKKKYIIWDFDGTVANTNGMIIESWQATFERYLGHRMPVRDIEATFGEVLSDTIRRLIPDEDTAEVRAYFRDYQAEHCTHMMGVFDGIKEVLGKLRELGYKNVIATSRTANSFHDYAEKLQLSDYFDETVTMEDVKNHKPDPECIEMILKRLDAEPEEAIMIGDTKYDIGCANNAGVDSALVGWSHYVDEDAMKADGFGPTYRIAKPADLLEILE